MAIIEGGVYAGGDYATPNQFPAGAPVAAHGSRQGSRDHYYAGRGRLAGTVKEKGTPQDLPLSRRVLLIDQRASFMVRETWSDAETGEYIFEYITQTPQYLVIAYDYEHNYRPAVADNLTAEPMP